MQKEGKSICLAVLQRIDNRYSCGYRLQSFHYKKTFEDFLQQCHGMIVGDEAVVILAGGKSETVTLAEAAEMNWIL